MVTWNRRWETAKVYKQGDQLSQFTWDYLDKSLSPGQIGTFGHPIFWGDVNVLNLDQDSGYMFVKTR